MYKRLFILINCLPLAALGQKLTASHPPVKYHIGSAKALLYREPADTAKSKSNYFLYHDEEAQVVGEYSPHWAVIKRTGFLYLVRTADIAGFNTARAKANQAADAAGFPTDPVTGRYTYQGVVEVPGVSKDELYRRAYEWVAQTYHSANAVIQMQDKEAGQLIAKGLTRVGYRFIGGREDAGVVYHTLTLYIKDGKYKYILTNFTHEGVRNVPTVGPLETPKMSGVFTQRIWQEIKQEANRDAYDMVANLNTSMTLKGQKAASDF